MQLHPDTTDGTSAEAFLHFNPSLPVLCKTLNNQKNEMQDKLGMTMIPVNSHRFTQRPKNKTSKKSSERKTQKTQILADDSRQRHVGSSITSTTGSCALLLHRALIVLASQVHRVRSH